MSTSSTSAAAASFVGLLIWCLQINAVGAEVAAPQNVTLVTLNTNYKLTWDWDQSAADSHAVNFTTQYVGKFKLKSKRTTPNWHTVCEETSRRLCDLTGSNMHYLGIYVIRVRATVNGRHSLWVEREFCPDKEAAIGPPSKVYISPAGALLDVNISNPLTSTNESMKEVLRDLYFHIIYWEGTADTKASEVLTLKSHRDFVTIPDLKAWTSYCVSVQSRCDYYNKSSSFTPPLCMQTAGLTPWWLITLSFLGSLVFFFLIVLLAISCSYKTYKTVKTVFHPTNQLPPHFKEYLNDSLSDIPRLLSPDSESELLCDKVTVLPVPVLEIHNPPPEALPAPPARLEPDSSGRHSRQGSSGSRDSGVYSTGGSSGLQQPNSSQSCSSQSSVGTESSSQGHFDLEQVKMHDMAPGLKSQPLIIDEGIVDIGV